MHVAIIGNGISGITAARWIRKLSDFRITVISNETDHFYSRTALMYVYMGHMRYEDIKPYEDWFWEKNRIDLKKGRVNSVDYNAKKLHFADDTTLNYDKLILAVGSKSNKFGWPGQDLGGVSGLYHYQDLEKMEDYSKNLNRAVIVGGGLIGIEMAEMFHSRNIPVTMLVRESRYWNNVLPSEESEMISKHIKDHHIDLRLSSNLQEILGDKNGNVEAVIIKETGEKIACEYVGLTPGVSPNVDFLKNSILEIGRGIKVNRYLETNVEDVYAIGDCAESKEPAPGRRAIEAVWYTGRMMGETSAYTITGNRKVYEPGIWFNSAKFLDIEYQVYGEVLNKAPDHHKSLFWKHEDDTKSVRIVYDQSTKAVLGFNLFGIRYRHEVCEKWLKEETHIEQVLEQLSLANFDPEFFKQYEQEIVNQYNRMNHSKIELKSKRKLDRVLEFLRS